MVKLLRSILSQLFILPRRLSLMTPGVHATIPILRGVWGAALHDLNAEAYATVFMGEGPSSDRVPAFILRPAAPSRTDAPALEWILIGNGLRYDTVLLRAWDVASGMGLGPERRRFCIRGCREISPGGDLSVESRESNPWSLYQATWPLNGPPETTPCRLTFPVPLRLIRNHRLVEQPALPDLVVAAVRRIQAFLPSPAREALHRTQPALLECARSLRAESWQGRRLDLIRYSGRQKTELEMRGVAGYLYLPEGPGHLWPLLAAAQWLHLGKGTVVGMGQLVVESA